MTFESKTWLFHIICRFYIWEFAYLLKFVCNLNLITWGHFHSHSCTCAEQWKLWVARCIRALGWDWTRWCSEIEQVDVLPSCFGSHTASKCPFHSMFSAKVLAFFCPFYWWFHCLKCPPSVLLKCYLVFPSMGRLWCALRRKKHKLCSGMSYTAVDHEFNVNESTIYIK